MRPHRFIDIGANLTDDMYRGIYRGKKAHPADINNVLSRAAVSGLDRIMVTAGTFTESEHARDIALDYNLNGCVTLTKEDNEGDASINKDDSSKIKENGGRSEHETNTTNNLKLYSTVGCHPTRCNEMEEDEGYLNKLRSVLASSSAQEEPREAEGVIVAIGECGLDYDRLEFCEANIQRKHFAAQFALAEESNLPMFLHCRNACDDFVQIVKENRHRMPKGGVVHSFDGTWEEASVLLDMGLSLGCNGCSLKHEHNLNVWKQVPIESIMIETDAPWCDIRNTHASMKYVQTKFEQKKKERHEMDKMVKGRNEPQTIIQVAEVLAGLKGMPLDVIVETTYQNTMKMFFPSLPSVGNK